MRKVAELHLEEKKMNKRRKFRSSASQGSAAGDQAQSRDTVSRAAMIILAEEEMDKRHQDLCQLPAQGEMTCHGKRPFLFFG